MNLSTGASLLALAKSIYYLKKKIRKIFLTFKTKDSKIKT